MGHNGKKIQTNIALPNGDWGYPFINLVKDIDYWRWTDDSSQQTFDFTTFDANGYPTAIGAHGGIQLYMPFPNFRTGVASTYVVRAKNCTIGGGGLSSTVFGSTLSDATFTPVPINNGGGQYQLRLDISAISGSLDIAVFHTDDTAAYNAGKIFQTQFKSLLNQVGVVRFMDAQQTNTSSVRSWADRTPVGHWSYAADHYPSGTVVAASAMTNSGTAYSLANTGFTLTDGARVISQFNVTPPANTAVTLNVNGTGAKTVTYAFGDSLTAGWTLYGNAWTHFIYNALLDSWLAYNVQYVTQGIKGGWPPEICVALINEMHDDYGSAPHPWFCIPTYAADWSGTIPTTANLPDYTTNLATYCKNNLPAGIVPRFEPYNEQWNGNFWANHLASNIQAKRNGGASGDQDNQYGVAASICGQVVNAVYGGTPATQTSYVFVNGQQTVGTTRSDRWNSSWFVTNGGSAAKNWATHISIAGYWQSDDYGHTSETTLATSYAVASDPTYLDQYLNDSLSTTNGNQFSLPAVANLYSTWDSTASSLGLKLTQYEGGYSPDWGGGEAANVTTLRQQSKKRSVLATLTRTNFDNFFNTSSRCEFPSEYVLSTSNTAYGIWDNAYGYDTYSGNVPPRWQAILDYNNSFIHHGGKALGRF